MHMSLLNDCWQLNRKFATKMRSKVCMKADFAQLPRKVATKQLEIQCCSVSPLHDLVANYNQNKHGAHALWVIRNRRAIRRNRIFRDRTNPMDIYNDRQIHRRFRLPRNTILDLVDELRREIEYVRPRKECLPPLLQVNVWTETFSLFLHSEFYCWESVGILHQ